MGRRGVVLCGGKGSRLLPLTHVASKTLLPVYDKPMIYYPLSTLMMAGIKEVMIIATSHDLYRFQTLFEDGSHLGMQITYGIQEVPKGTADAFLVAETFLAGSSVALVLGDNIFSGTQIEDALAVAATNKIGATVFGYEVAQPERHGVLEFDGEGQVIDVIEKPRVSPSAFVVPGLYFYDQQVMEITKQLRPSARGELEITDVNKAYIRKGMLDVIKLGRGNAWFDAGEFEDLHKASTYVQILQKMHNVKIACIEEVAYRKGFIDRLQLEQLAREHAASEYGDYLFSLTDN